MFPHSCNNAPTPRGHIASRPHRRKGIQANICSAYMASHSPFFSNADRAPSLLSGWPMIVEKVA